MTSYVSGSEQGGTALSSSVYHLLPGDLRDFRSSLASQLGTILDPKLPLLVLAECVTIYLPPAATQSVLSWALDTWRGSSSSVVLYDPVGLDDSFGKVMIHNLQVDLACTSAMLSNYRCFRLVAYSCLDWRRIPLYRCIFND